MRRLWVLALASSLSCELVVRAGDYQQPYQGLCVDECKDVSGLRRAPCPPLGRDAGPDEGPDAGTYVYAWRTVALGSKPPDGGAYDIGLDQDCSTRAPSGRPVMCDPVNIPDGGAPLLILSPPRWSPLPDGVDNSLGQRVLVPLVQYAAKVGTPLDVDAILSERLERGEAGELVVVERWNGRPDDPDVQVTFLGTNGVMTPPAAWDGTDRWIPNGNIAGYPHFSGYVSAGVLVVDTRGATEEDLHITLKDSHGNPASFFISGRLMARVGTITPDELTLVSYGRWDLADALRVTDSVAGFLSGEPSADAGNLVRGILANDLPGLLEGAADLPLGTDPTPGLPCAAVSLALKATAPRVQLQGAQP